MLISKFSKDGKRGFSVGSNSLTPEKVAAGAVTALSALVIMLVGGVFRLFVKPSQKGKKAKKKKPLWLLAMPIVYKKARDKLSADNTAQLLSDLVKQYSGEEAAAEDAPMEESCGVEVVEALPITSEDEVYSL